MFNNPSMVRNCTLVEKVHHSFDEVYHCTSLEGINNSEGAKTQPKDF
jgi:hypothetical protein